MLPKYAMAFNDGDVPSATTEDRDSQNMEVHIPLKSTRKSTLATTLPTFETE